MIIVATRCSTSGANADPGDRRHLQRPPVDGRRLRVVFAGLLLTGGAFGRPLRAQGRLTIDLVVFGAASVSAAVSDSASQVLITRGIIDVGAALVMPATLSILVTVFPSQERGRASGSGPDLRARGRPSGPSPADGCSSTSGGVRCSSSTSRSSPSPWSAGTPRPHVAGPPRTASRPRRALLSIGALGSILYAIIEAPDHGWIGNLALLAAGIGLVFAGGFAAWELHTPYPMLDLRFFKTPLQLGPAAIMLVSSPSSARSSCSPSTCSCCGDTPPWARACTPCHSPHHHGDRAMSSKVVDRFGTRW